MADAGGEDPLGVKTRLHRYDDDVAGTVHALLLRLSEQGPRKCRLPVVPLALRSGLMLLPLTTEIVAGLMGAERDAAPVAGFYSLSGDVAEWARRSSQHGVVAYLHTEFFGGEGFHAAMAWRDGSVAWGPMFTATSVGEAEEHYVVAANRRDLAGNVLLRWLGVQAADEIDEFAAAGLGRCRWTEEWAELVTP